MPSRPPPRRPSSSPVRSRERALGRVDAPRGERDGTRRVEKKRRNRARRRLVGSAIALALFIGLLFGAVFPTRTYLTQRTANRKADTELADVQAEARAAADARAELESRAEVESRAREELGYVKPGEEAYTILPAAPDPVGLPAGWPFTGVEAALRGG